MDLKGRKGASCVELQCCSDLVFKAGFIVSQNERDSTKFP